MAEPLTLTGRVRGGSREDLLSEAREDAERFFGISCVSVRILKAEKVGVVFMADFKAREHHRVEIPTYGPAWCLDCKREKYNSGPAIPVANWEA